MEQGNSWEKQRSGFPNGQQATIRDLLAGRIQSGSKGFFPFITFGTCSPCVVLLSLCISNQLSFFKCHAHLFKVLGNKVLPLVSLVVVLAYWMLGLTLPSTESNILDVSNCTLPVWGSLYVSSVFENITDNVKNESDVPMTFWFSNFLLILLILLIPIQYHIWYINIFGIYPKSACFLKI